MRFKNDPDGTRLPVTLDSTSNGEFVPRPLAPHLRQATAVAHRRVDDNARKLHVSRRQFMVSLSGAATTFLALNVANAWVGKTGGEFVVPAIAATDADAAAEALGKKEFIFDIQTHHFDPPAEWTEPTPWSEAIRATAGTTDCNVLPDEDFGYMSCTDARAFVREIFMDSDTDAAVLSFVPTGESKMPLSYDNASATRQAVNALGDGQRLFLHGRIIPSLPGDLERMDEVLETWDIAAWKTYTQYGPERSSGWWLDDQETGQPFLEKVRASGIKTVCVHKGLPLPFPLMGDQNLQYRFCRDVGPAARVNPDIRIIVYHSGFDEDLPEGPFQPGNPQSGADSLIQSMRDSGLPANGSNVYAELGTTWHQVMRDPDQAAHLLGKLLAHVGEDNILWGTDSIFYGSPQDQIQAFRTFQISAEFQERFGYPPLTEQVKAKIFGLNAMRAYGLDLDLFRAQAKNDPIGRARAGYQPGADPSFRTYGPRTRREFLQLARMEAV